jgi:uncharacterized membrane protein
MDIFLLALLAIGALVWAWRNASEVEHLEEQHGKLRQKIDRLGSELKTLQDELGLLKTRPTPSWAPVEFVKSQPVEIAKPGPPVETIRIVEPTAEVKPTVQPAVTERRDLVSPRVSSPASQPATRPAKPQPIAPKPHLDWEAVIGVKLFSWVAGIALVLAGIFFLKYSVEHGWLSPPIRMAVGLLTGAGLLAVCEVKAARRYAVTANALDGAGIAILFSTFFAAHILWGLIGVTSTFAFMAIVAALAVLLSIRRDSLFIAVLGLVGGFATPALLSTGDDRPVALFGYLVLLNAGLAWIAYKKRWPYLTVLSTLFTTIYQWGWVMKFLQTGNIPLALGIFLVFPILSFAPGLLAEDSDDKSSLLFRKNSAVSVALPLLFAMYMSAVPAYAERYWLLFGFLLLIDAGLAAIARTRGPELLHVLGGVTTVAVLCIWLQVSYTSAAWPVILPIVAVFVLFYLAAGRWLNFADIGKRAVYAAPLLLAAFPILAAIEPATSSPYVLFNALLALLSAVAYYATARKDIGVHFVAAFFTLAAEAVWSAKHLGPDQLVPAAVLYVVFALFYLWAPPAPNTYLALAGHAFLFWVALQTSLALTPWPLLGTLVVLNVAIGIAALRSRRGELHLGAILASQLVVCVWQTQAAAAPWPAIAIIYAAATAAMALGWFMAARRLQLSCPFFAAAAAGAAFLGFVAIVAAESVSGVPQVALLVAASVFLIALALSVDWLTEWHSLAPLAVIAGGLVVLVWSQYLQPEHWQRMFWFAAAVYAVFLLYPVAIGSRARTLLEPYLAAVMASAFFFFFARQSLLAGGYADRIGLLPDGQALLMSGLLWRLLQLEPRGKRTLGRLALVAGSVLAFVTVAIPLQLENHWITIGWALQAAALAWLWRKIPHKGLVAWTTGLLAAVLWRLLLDPSAVYYGAPPIWNWYLYTYLVAAGAFFAAAWFLRDAGSVWDGLPRVKTLGAAGGTLLLFALLNIEIANYYFIYSSRPDPTLNFTAALAKDLTYTIAWGLFAFGLLIAGIVLHSKAARVSAIVLLSVTIGKCFLLDLSRLNGLYRVGSFVGLAACLTLVALLLQKFVLRPEAEAKQL